ncbi:hypothetical protein ACFYPK_19310 [Streptomyces halstedii]|uniref:hypothetical protein n=1 Tax=Streptomyces TaxID=1883 RepID=UPI0004A906F1|nr:hypothetical protein [Streptomyces sp. NTK 937]KDQ71335.1 hypothetical protein DT87_30300 [Streptomyces sp. NTK 937]WSX34272.1 hypothetical protein OG291_00680 [Streptomyces halstedii]
MERTDIGPRHFGGKLGYHRAVLLTDPRRWLVVAGHEARDAEGAIAHVGDIRGQLRLTTEVNRRATRRARRSPFADRSGPAARPTAPVVAGRGKGPWWVGNPRRG